ncbi:hypothetical protein HY612_04165 [Candidatus Roizmanbacteria bacterium]|nr:hypothetical protein [Candidatus Roizmanbacteria bacterium]
MKRFPGKVFIAYLLISLLLNPEIWCVSNHFSGRICFPFPASLTSSLFLTRFYDLKYYLDLFISTNTSLSRYDLNYATGRLYMSFFNLFIVLVVSIASTYLLTNQTKFKLFQGNDYLKKLLRFISAWVIAMIIINGIVYLATVFNLLPASFGAME